MQGFVLASENAHTYPHIAMNLFLEVGSDGIFQFLCTKDILTFPDAAYRILHSLCEYSKLLTSIPRKIWRRTELPQVSNCTTKPAEK